jgi:hypothetical protein
MRRRGLISITKQRGDRTMTSKKLAIAAALLIGMTTASLAQNGYYNSPYGYGPAPGVNVVVGGSPYGYGVYDYAPGYSYYGYGTPRGGSGARFGNGNGAGIGSQR